MKTLFKFLFIISLLSVSACAGKVEKAEDCKTCKSFATQKAAKAYAKKNPVCKKSLDQDGDGRFCEALPKE